MRKEALAVVAVMLVCFIITPSLVKAEEELMVPLREIKFEYLDKVDATRAKIPFSELEEKWISEDWLEENNPEPKKSEFPSDYPIEKLVKESPSLEDVLKVIDGPWELQKFMKNYFKVEFHHGWAAYSPREFLRLRTGDCKDWAHFFAYVLSKKGYKAKQLAYVNKFNWEGFIGHVIAVYWSPKGVYKYSVASRIYGPFEDIEELLEMEALYPDVKISFYSLYPADQPDALPSLNKNFTKWTKKNTPKAGEKNIEVSNPTSSGHSFFARIVEIENKGSRTIYTAAVQLNSAFKEYSTAGVLADFIITSGTEYYAAVNEKNATPVKTSKEKVAVNPGDLIFFQISERTTSIESTGVFEVHEVWKYFESKQELREAIR